MIIIYLLIGFVCGVIGGFRLGSMEEPLNREDQKEVLKYEIDRKARNDFVLAEKRLRMAADMVKEKQTKGEEDVSTH